MNARRLGVLGLTLGATGCLLTAPSTSSALTCRAGFVKNQGRCVKRPPAGVPAPGYYKFDLGPVIKVGMEVRYETRNGAFKNKFIVLLKIRIPTSGLGCADGKPAPSSETLKSDRMKIVSKAFTKTGISSPNRSSASISGRFITTSRIDVILNDSYTTSDLPSRPATTCKAQRVGTPPFVRGTRNDVI